MARGAIWTFDLNRTDHLSDPQIRLDYYTMRGPMIGVIARIAWHR